MNSVLRIQCHACVGITCIWETSFHIKVAKCNNPAHRLTPRTSQNEKKSTHLMSHSFTLYSSVSILVYFQIRYEVNIWQTIQLHTFFYMPSTTYFRQIPKYSWLWLNNEINTCQYGYLKLSKTTMDI